MERINPERIIEMKVELDLHRHICKVTKEKGDPYFSRSDWSDAESTFLYHVKEELIKQGYDVIKKRMWIDGHLVADSRQYIRTRSTNSDDFLMVYNSNYAAVDAGEEFNKNGFYNLTIA